MGQASMRAAIKHASALALLALALTACSAQTDEDEPEVRGSIRMDAAAGAADGGKMQAQIRGKDGQTIDVSSDPAAPVALPAGFTLFPGATVKSNTALQMGEGKAAVVAFDSDAAPAAIAAHYRRQAQSAGMDITHDVAGASGIELQGEKGSGSGFQLAVQAAGAGSKATLMVGSGMGEP